MTARTHDVVAFASLLTLAAYSPPSSLNVTTAFACVIGNVIGALIPDMDQASNRLWDLFPAGDHVGKIFRRIFFKHRTLSHSILGAVLIYKGLEWLLPRLLNAEYVNVGAIFASIMIGYVSHLLADAVTKDGIPLFFPFSYEIGIPPIKVLRIRTDSWVEYWVVLPAVVGYIAWFVNDQQDKFRHILSLIAKS